MDTYVDVRISEQENGLWEIELYSGLTIRAYGASKREAYNQFIAIYELYREYGEEWMTKVLSEKSEEYRDAYIEAFENPWEPNESL